MGNTLRIYPNLGTALAKHVQHSETSSISRGLWFHLLHSTHLKIMSKGEKLIFKTPDKANDFYEKQVLVHSKN